MEVKMGFDDKIFGNPDFNPERCFISSRSAVIGRVIIEDDVIIAPGASIRADEGSPFRIGRCTNIQDEVIIHGLLDRFVTEKGGKYSVYIGPFCSLAHGALIHGPVKIGEKTFIGFRVIIHNSTVGKNCFISHGAIIDGVRIADGKYVKDGMVVDDQEKADELPQVPPAKAEFNQEVVEYNKKLCRMYRERREAKLRGM
jgi:carbonic anhydrase/acetyltransferase-like protein (isoleucine patch superfamily)